MAGLKPTPCPLLGGGKFFFEGTAPEGAVPSNSLLDRLNPQQRLAVTTTEGPVLVIAGAGSGKTNTLVHRVAYLIDLGVPPSSILLLTFTRKSAQDMLRRAALVGDRRSENVMGGTFHSFAHSVLRREGHCLGYTAFTILDRADAESLIGTIRAEIVQKSEKRFPQKGTLLDVIGKHINLGISISDVLLREYPQFCEFSTAIEQLFARYICVKKTMQVVDYDDLLTLLVQLFEAAPDVSERLQQHYTYIMVDEYQDTNILQAAIVRALAGVYGNVMVVGDDAQSIYGFRGADSRNIGAFLESFPSATQIMLTENYRSTQPILDLTNAVITRSREVFKKELFTANKGGDKPVFVEVGDVYAQSAFVVQRIQELEDSGISLSDMAVLFRAGWHSNNLELSLHAAGIPFEKFGGFKFIESGHVKDVLAFLRILQNPKDSLGWYRVLTLLEGLGEKTASDIVQRVLGSDPDPVYGYHGAFLPFYGRRFGKNLQDLADVLLHWVTLGDSPVVVLSGVLDYFRPYFESRYDDFQRREPDLDTLVLLAAKYDSLSAFVSELLLDPPLSQGDLNAVDNDAKLTLSTIHSAKGLEWKIVFVLSLVDGYLPSFQSSGDLRQLEEERRLLYVAMTRAKSQLYLLKPTLQSHHPGIWLSRPSRFLLEVMTGELVSRWVLTDDEAPSVSPDLPKRYGF